jgi:hypothetical protein
MTPSSLSPSLGPSTMQLRLDQSLPSCRTTKSRQRRPRRPLCRKTRRRLSTQGSLLLFGADGPDAAHKSASNYLRPVCIHANYALRDEYSSALKPWLDTGCQVVRLIDEYFDVDEFLFHYLELSGLPSPDSPDHAEKMALVYVRISCHCTCSS